MEMIVLGIETSCDETAAAIVTSHKQILSNVIVSQIDDHQPYGGVIPEVGARQHLRLLPQVVEKALHDAHVTIQDISAIVATGGPGLIGGVIVGATMAKAMALSNGKPFFAINHLEGHALTARLTDEVSFPFLLLLVSGGHTQLLVVKGVGQYQVLGTTLDDAVGETFDKVAKMLGLPYPGGPAIERLARGGNKACFSFPRPMCNRADCMFSFSGLKTAVRYALEDQPELNAQTKADVAASFQQAIADVLVHKVKQAFQDMPDVNALVVAGGVAANSLIRSGLETVMSQFNKAFYAPPLSLCTDNAAMIAWAGIERINAGISPTSFDFMPRPRWPLDSL